MIRVDRPFILLANCSINYQGRAKSNLIAGNYLVIRKGDGSLLIHGGAKMVPLNYQPPGAIMTKEDNKLISKRKDETIEITINRIHQFSEVNNWSYNKINISMTEDDLRTQIIEQIDTIIGEPISQIHKEFSTPVGSVDLLAEGTIYHVIEIKRGKASLASCAQLERYLGYFKEIGQECHGWLISPQVSQGAFDYCQKHQLTWKCVHHRQSHEEVSSTDSTATGS